MVKFSEDEVELIYEIAEELTGSTQSQGSRKEILVLNVQRRIHDVGVHSLAEYLELVESDPEEWAYLLSSLTIHTTSWFREKPHYEMLLETITEYWNSGHRDPILIWSAACSTGQELYSAGLICEQFRTEHPGFDYHLYGTDIDPVSVKTAQNAIYPVAQIKEIKPDYKKLLLVGSGKTQNLFTFTKEIRSRSTFTTTNLDSNEKPFSDKQFHFVFCRNVLIYFELKKIMQIVERLTERVRDNGILCLGHSETLQPHNLPLRGTNRSWYKKIPAHKETRSENQKMVLVVDDSAVVRAQIVKILEKSGFAITEAASAEEASEKLNINSVDLVTLDLNLGTGMDGWSWLKHQRTKGFTKPVVIVSDSSPSEAGNVLGALTSGAQDFVEKGWLSREPQAVADLFKSLIHSSNQRVLVAKKSNQTRRSTKPKLYRPELILVGASTGGPEALIELLQKMPKPCPPVLVVQHISPNFAKAFAERLTTATGLESSTNLSGETLRENHIYMARGDYHIEVKRSKSNLVCVHSDVPPVSSHRPSVDHLFYSVAKLKPTVRALAILLTGMGRDGALGMLELNKTNSCITVAQDEESSVVYGMPKEAVNLKAVQYQGNISEIRQIINDCLRLPVEFRNIA